MSIMSLVHDIAEPTDEDLAEIESTLSPSSEDCLLEALWEDVKHNVVKKQVHKDVKRKMLDAEESTRQVYLNPENWLRTRCIALIHNETQTCLGNYSEFIHKRVKDCRKLLREEAPIEVTGVEIVSGSWWLPQAIKPEPAQVWHQRIPAMLHLHLDQLHVHATAVPVIACLSYGALARCELVEETKFATWEEPGVKNGHTILYLPKGTNVLEVMSRDSKIKLKEITG